MLEAPHLWDGVHVPIRYDLQQLALRCAGPMLPRQWVKSDIGRNGGRSQPQNFGVP